MQRRISGSSMNGSIPEMIADMTLMQWLTLATWTLLMLSALCGCCCVQHRRKVNKALSIQKQRFRCPGAKRKKRFYWLCRPTVSGNKKAEQYTVFGWAVGGLSFNVFFNRTLLQVVLIRFAVSCINICRWSKENWQ